MSDPNTSDNWRLEESGDAAGQWKLEETEQNRISQWELQNEGQIQEAGWQPVEYTRDPYQQQGGGGGWVLPSLVGLALIAVVAYGAWIGMTQLDLRNFGSLITSTAATPLPTAAGAAALPADTPTATVDAGGAVAAATDTPAPTDTPPSPTATATSLPTTVEERYVSVIEQYGINARNAPSTDAEVLRVVGLDEEFLILNEEPGWYQIPSSTGQLAWISSDPQFVSVRSAELSVADANFAREALGVELLPNDSGEVAVAPTSEAVTETVPITGGISAIDDINTDGPTIVGTVNITAGLNARSQPDTNSELVSLLANGTALDLNGRTADNAWLRSVLEDGTTVWLFAQFMTVDGDVATLPVIDVPGVVATDPTTATTSITTTTDVSLGEITSTTPITDVAPEIDATEGDEPATASVNSILGAAIRNAPEAGADAVATATFENVLTVIGRSADDAWLQVDLGEEGTGWVQVSAVDLSVPLESLTVINP